MRRMGSGWPIELLSRRHCPEPFACHGVGTPRVQAITLARRLNAGDGLELADDDTWFVVEIFDPAISSNPTAANAAPFTRRPSCATLARRGGDATMLGWSSPFNWCDRRCERCALTDRCALWAREQERRALHETAGRDPDDPATWIDDVQADLGDAVEMLIADARERGLDPDELASSPPPALPPLAERLRRAGHDLAIAAAAVGGEVGHVAMILGGKCARLGGLALDDDDDELLQLDVVPNVLLIEALDDELAAAIERSVAAGAALARTRERHAELRRALAPFAIRVPAEARVALAALVRARRAPSPFWTVKSPAELPG